MAAATGLLVWLAGTPSAALGQVAEPQRPVVWRVEGGAEALAPSARVRLVVINAVSSDSVDPTLGLVQTVLVLATPPASAAADALALEAVRRGLTVVEPDHELTPAGGGDLRVTVAPAAISTEDYAVAVVLGRPVKVLGLDAAAASGGEYQALRADREDLEDRRRWAAETLIQPGTERQVWEGIVPASVSRIYADALVIRNTRASVAAGSDVPSVTRRLDHPRVASLICRRPLPALVRSSGRREAA